MIPETDPAVKTLACLYGTQQFQSAVSESDQTVIRSDASKWSIADHKVRRRR